MNSQTAAPTTMRQLEDHSRVLLIFSQSDSDPQLRQQIETLSAHASDLNERDLLLVSVPAVGPAPNPTAYQATLSESDAARQRLRFHIQPDQFAVLLIGKDGGEKLRSSAPLTLDRLKSVIDAMPMRQDEVRNQQR